MNKPNGHAGLQALLEALRPELVKAAQQVYDAWQQDEDGMDEVFGTGGICDEIAQEMSGVLSHAGIDVVEGGQDGDDHAWLFVCDAAEAFEVDLPYCLYEHGAGYCWTKINGVVFTPEDVMLTKVDRADVLFTGPKLGRPKLPGSKVMSSHLHFRVTKTLRRDYSAAAKLQGTTLHRWCRDVLSKAAADILKEKP